MAGANQPLGAIYRQRFAGSEEYRRGVWGVLTASFFQEFIGAKDTVLDLGCGYGEFINQIRCGAKLGMDLNPDSAKQLGADVRFLHQDSSQPWPLETESLDVIFTSNYFEHLPSKEALSKTLAEAARTLRPGGKLIAMGPNLKLAAGAYWDFWDHHVPLTELSLSEALRNHGFSIARCEQAFLPFQMSDGRRYPLFFVRAYLAMPWAWRIFGKQFLVVAVKQTKA